MKSFLNSLVVLIFISGAITVLADNLLSSDSVSKENGWQAFVQGSAMESGASVNFMSGSAVVKSCPIEEEPAVIQIFKFIDVDADKSYKLSFEAHADKPGRLVVYYCLGKSPWFKYASEEINVEAGQKLYECELEVKRVPGEDYDTPRSLRLMLGAFEDATISISNMSFEPDL